MKALIRFALIACALLIPASASKAAVAVGIIVGEPTGLSIRIDRFPVLGVAWSLRNNWMYIQGDYWLLHTALNRAYPLNFYLGPGVYVALGGGDFYGGIRIPIGLQWVLQRHWELFGELAPVIDLFPEPGFFDIQGGIGIRYIF